MLYVQNWPQNCMQMTKVSNLHVFVKQEINKTYGAWIFLGDYVLYWIPFEAINEVREFLINEQMLLSH